MHKKLQTIYQNNKQATFLIFLSLFIIITASILRLFGPEDYWTCRNGQWVKHGQPKASQPTSICLTPNNSNSQPITVVENFYSWYFQSNKEKLDINNIRSQKYFTSNFLHTLSAKSLYDAGNPFMCHFDESLLSYNIYEVYQKQNKAIISVYQNFINSQDKLDFTLIKKNNIWQIDSIQCTKLIEATLKLNQSYN